MKLGLVADIVTIHSLEKQAGSMGVYTFPLEKQADSMGVYLSVFACMLQKLRRRMYMCPPIGNAR